MSGEIRILGAGDEALLFAFLEQHLESSIFLVSNIDNDGAVRAYTTLGYRAVSDFCLLLFR